MTRRTLRFLSLPLVAVMLSACSAAASPTPAPTPAATPVASTVAAAATPTANPCDKATLATLHAGKLTIGTDNPAYPPYFQPPASGNATAPWELGDPTNGQGFEAAVAYAVAAKLGYAQADVSWTVVSFDNSYAPGTKPFDVYLGQVSYTSDRAQQVDMSDGYYFVNQAVVSLKTNAISSAKTIADLKQYKLGAQEGTRPTTPSRTRSSRLRPQPSTTAMTPPSRRSRPSRSTASWWICRPPSTSPRPSSTAASSSASFRRRPAPRPSTSASLCPRAAG